VILAVVWRMNCGGGKGQYATALIQAKEDQGLS